MFHIGSPHILCLCNHICLVDYRHLHSDNVGYTGLEKTLTYYVLSFVVQQYKATNTLISHLTKATSILCVTTCSHCLTANTSILTLWNTHCCMIGMYRFFIYVQSSTSLVYYTNLGVYTTLRWLFLGDKILLIGILQGFRGIFRYLDLYHTKTLNQLDLDSHDPSAYIALTATHTYDNALSWPHYA